MRALTYHGAGDVRVDTVPDPVLAAPDDILVQVTATAICGSDLHLYRGKMPGLREGDILGHEFMGRVVETGREVRDLAVGDRVVVPFVIACGACHFCKRQLPAACETTNTGPGSLGQGRGIRPGAALFGYTHLYGGVPGGQAELVRVPRANAGPIRVEEGLEDERVLFLSDILPTGYQAVLDTGVGPGDSLVILGAGPVGLMAAACARMLEVDPIFIVDPDPHRLAFAFETFGAYPVNLDETDPAEAVITRTEYRGADGVIDAVGLEAKGSALETVMASLHLEGGSGSALRQAIACARRGATISVPGVYAGQLHGFPFGDAFDKGLTFRMGQTHVQRYLPELLALVREGHLRPEAIITHRLPLERAAEGYRIFDTREEACRKVVLFP